jgi:hypothetical protein
MPIMWLSTPVMLHSPTPVMWFRLPNLYTRLSAQEKLLKNLIFVTSIKSILLVLIFLY